MAAPLLPFLYPRLYTLTQHAAAPTICQILRRPSHRPSVRPFSISSCWDQTPRERHGKAIEPDPVLLQSKPPPPATPASLPAPEAASVESESSQREVDNQPSPRSGSAQQLLNAKDEQVRPSDEASPPRAATSTIDTHLPLAVIQTPQTDLRPLESVLQFQDPALSAEDRRPPHLHAPPYVHHFDTYSLVQDLTKDAYTDSQAVTLMKSIRASLADHLETAKDGLISKSNVENDSYLFKAACSELRTEINSQRYATRTRDKSETIRLEHERDVLTQRLSQDLSTLKDDFTRLFNDRKMAVREHQKARDLTIQELNFKIAVSMGGDMKPHIEALRWSLTIRGVAGLLICVTTILLLLSGNAESKEKHAQKLAEERKTQARIEEEAKNERGRIMMKATEGQNEKEGISVESLSMG